ncbi:MAG TPA: hypothetical protein VFN49_00355, partial [Candidatus Aquilonibacter sp.]|nr:hypothetical protein [Candidatus Aquilonibacter sp.]
MEEVEAKRVAVVCVHGVASHPRYEFQDQVSSLFCQRLNEALESDEWVVDVVNPGNVLPHGSEDPLPTISRVHRRSDQDPTSPDGSFFDVIEAYWSPITKGYTNWLWVVNWILKVVFVPLNTTASYNASAAKQFFDYGYIGGALVAAFVLFFISISAAWESFLAVLDVTGLLKQRTANDVLATLNANANVPLAGVPIKIIVWLIVGLVGAFLLGQALSAIFKLIVQRKALSHNPKARWHRGVAIAILSVLGVGCMYAMATVHFPNGYLGWKGIALIVL